MAETSQLRLAGLIGRRLNCLVSWSPSTHPHTPQHSTTKKLFLGTIYQQQSQDIDAILSTGDNLKTSALNKTQDITSRHRRFLRESHHNHFFLLSLSTCFDLSSCRNKSNISSSSSTGSSSSFDSIPLVQTMSPFCVMIFITPALSPSSCGVVLPLPEEQHRLIVRFHFSPLILDFHSIVFSDDN